MHITIIQAFNSVRHKPNACEAFQGLTVKKTLEEIREKVTGFGTQSWRAFVSKIFCQLEKQTNKSTIFKYFSY